MSVVPPPGVGTILTAPYVPPPVTGCDLIPLVSNPYMSAGTFIDRKVDRKRIYWYKVLGVDRNGNQSDPDQAVAISTFTFATNRETPPIITEVTPTDNPCALTVKWMPAYDAAAMKGFFVFRSTAMNGSYYQLEGLQKTNTFVDNSVARNVTYWYRVVMLRNDGMLTNLSEPKNGIHP
jgi:fibronectin type 3 domain-containing protein